MQRFNFRNLIILLSLGMIATACRDEVGDGSMIVEDPIEEVETEGTEQYLTLDSDYIFDQTKFHTFELTLPESSLTSINLNPAAEEYVEGSLHFEGEVLSPVGIRYKGSIGAYAGCLSGTNPFEPSGVKTCTKLSMKVKINWDGREEKFYGLKKLQFHSMNQDPTQMRERLGYKLYNDMGVAAPRCTHARLLINGVFVGVFALVEQIDGRFSRYNWDDGEGNVYKEVWPLTSGGNANSKNNFLDALRTNEDDNPSVDIMQSFAEALEQADDDELQSVVEEYMDVDKIIALCAVDRAIKADDGPFHWYCTFGNCFNHNFYWYEEPGSRQLHLVPWDMDNSFENIRTAQNGVVEIKDEWGETQNNCEPFNAFNIAFFIQLQQRSAACDKLTKAWTMYESLYEQKRQELFNGPMSAGNVNFLLSSWQAQIDEATQEARDSHADALNPSTWQQAIESLKDDLEYARNQ